MREISETPSSSCIWGETRLGFVMPLGSLFTVVLSAAGLDDAAVVTVRKPCMFELTESGRTRRREDDGDFKLANDTISLTKVLGKTPKETAIFT